MRLTVICNPFSIVIVPFPFTDKLQTKRRPALVLSSVLHQKETGHITLLMITSAKNNDWSSDYSIEQLKSTGLTSPSIIRQKIFTIDNRLILDKIGCLHNDDEKEIKNHIMRHLALEI